MNNQVEWYCKDIVSEGSDNFYILTSSLCKEVKMHRNDVFNALKNNTVSIKNLRLSSGKNPRIIHDKMEISGLKVYENKINDDYIRLKRIDLRNFVYPLMEGYTGASCDSLNISTAQNYDSLVGKLKIMGNKFLIHKKFDICAFRTKDKAIKVVSKAPILIDFNDDLYARGFDITSKSYDINNMCFDDTQFPKLFSHYYDSDDILSAKLGGQLEERVNNIRVANSVINSYDMEETFTKIKLTNLILENISLPNLVSIKKLLCLCRIDKLVIRNVSIPNLVYIDSLIYECEIGEIIVDSLDISNVRALRNVFNNCKIGTITFNNMPSLDKITDLTSFAECAKFNCAVDFRNITNKNGSIRTIQNMFYCTYAKAIDLSNLNIATIVNTDKAFATINCGNIINPMINKIASTNSNVQVNKVDVDRDKKAVMISRTVLKKVYGKCIEIDPTLIDMQDDNIYKRLHDNNSAECKAIYNFITKKVEEFKQLNESKLQDFTYLNRVYEPIKSHLPQIIKLREHDSPHIFKVSLWSMSFHKVGSIKEIKNKIKGNSNYLLTNIDSGLYMLIKKSNHTCKIMSEYTMKLKRNYNTNDGLFNDMGFISLDLSNLVFDASEKYMYDLAGCLGFSCEYSYNNCFRAKYLKIGNFNIIGMNMKDVLKSLNMLITESNIGIIDLENSQFSFDANSDKVYKYYAVDFALGYTWDAKVARIEYIPIPYEDIHNNGTLQTYSLQHLKAELHALINALPNKPDIAIIVNRPTGIKKVEFKDKLFAIYVDDGTVTIGHSLSSNKKSLVTLL